MNPGIRNYAIKYCCWDVGGEIHFSRFLIRGNELLKEPKQALDGSNLPSSRIAFWSLFVPHLGSPECNTKG